MSIIAEKTGVSFQPLNTVDSEYVHTVKRGKTGFFSVIMAEILMKAGHGLCFENFGFDYHTLMSEEIKEGNLNKKYDVIVLPND